MADTPPKIGGSPPLSSSPPEKTVQTPSPSSPGGKAQTPPAESAPAQTTPPGSTWITARPSGPGTRGHPILLSENGIVLGGLGGVHNGKPLAEVYKTFPQWEDHEGDQIPENLRHVNPAHNPHLEATAHFGPEFAAKVEGQPQYQGGKWRARVRNPVLEQAAQAGHTDTPEGGRIAPNPDRGVTYEREGQHPGSRGYMSFALSMGRDLVGHVRNWLAGEHDARRAAMSETERFNMGRPKGGFRPRPTLAEQAPSFEAPWGYEVGGGKRHAPRFPGDPLSWEEQSRRAQERDRADTATPSSPETSATPPAQEGQPPQGPKLDRILDQMAQEVDAEQGEGGRRPVVPGGREETFGETMGRLADDLGAAGPRTTPPAEESARRQADLEAKNDRTPLEQTELVRLQAQQRAAGGAGRRPVVPGGREETFSETMGRLADDLGAAGPRATPSVEESTHRRAELEAKSDRTPLEHSELLRLQARQRATGGAGAQPPATPQGPGGEAQQAQREQALAARAAAPTQPAGQGTADAGEQERALPGFDREPGVEPVEQSGGPGAKTHERKPGETMPVDATPPDAQYQQAAPVAGQEAVAAPSSLEVPPGAGGAASSDGSPEAQGALERIGRATPQRDLAGAAAGWKLHLAAPREHHDAVNDELQRMEDAGQIVHYKRGQSGGQEGKDFTVYAGHYDRAEAAAQHIEERLGDRLHEPRGEALTDDTPFGDHVAGRFDIGAVDRRFHQYGRYGIPFLNEDMAHLATHRLQTGQTDPDLVAQAEERAHKQLAQDYGSFYAGSPPTTQGSGPSAAPATHGEAGAQTPPDSDEASMSAEPPSQETAGPPPGQQPARAKGRGSGLEEGTLQHVRDHIVARRPVGTSVNVGTVAREVTGGDRAQAKALLDELVQRGVLGRFGEHLPTHYAVQPGHGTSGVGTGDAPAATIRQGGQSAAQKPQAASGGSGGEGVPQEPEAASEQPEGGAEEHPSPAQYAAHLADMDPEEREAYEQEARDEESRHSPLVWAKGLFRAIRDLGGIAKSHAGAAEYAELPIVVKNKNSPHSTDTLLQELCESNPQFCYEDANALHDDIVRAGRIHMEHKINVFGRLAQPRSKWATLQLRRERGQKRAQQRAVQQAGLSIAAPVHESAGEERMAGEPEGALGPYGLDDESYAVPAKRLLPISTPQLARQSWDVLDRTGGLTREEHDEAEDRILDALHLHGVPEHELPPDTHDLDLSVHGGLSSDDDDDDEGTEEPDGVQSHPQAADEDEDQDEDEDEDDQGQDAVPGPPQGRGQDQEDDQERTPVPAGAVREAAATHVCGQDQGGLGRILWEDLDRRCCPSCGILVG